MNKELPWIQVLILALTVFLASSTAEPIPDALTDDEIRVISLVTKYSIADLLLITG